MHSRLRVLLLVVLILFAFTGLVRAFPAAPQTGGLSLDSPATCPPGGCAAGQRLNLTLTYSLSTFNPATNPNVQVCLYTSSTLAASAFTLTPVGGLTGVTYTSDDRSSTDCGTTPDGYAFMARANTQLSNGITGDTIHFAFRIGATAFQDGTVLARVFENNGTAWNMTLETAKTIPVAMMASSVYVANEAAACNNNSPCYLNSGDDLPDGLGTGLKDAVDVVARGSTVTILGAYEIKSNTVVISQGVTLRGANNSSLTYPGTQCTEPMLDLRSSATISSLSIDSGACASPARDLIAVNSDTEVIIESNDLHNGNDAIHLGDFAGNVLVRFNQIQNNTGFAINVDNGSTGAGQLMAVANNFIGNGGGKQVECHSRGQVDHNFWGTGILPSAASSNCTSADVHRLGAAIHHLVGTPGVEAIQVTVTSLKTYAFNNQIAFQHADTQPDLGLYIINHGTDSNASVPFTDLGAASPTACSNYWDVFLKDGQSLPTEQMLSLFFKYNLNSGCTSTVESTFYCASPTANPPLWWYDPSGVVSTQWTKTHPDTGGQATACLTDLDEIRVDTDATGHPGLLSDMNFTPFVVGLEQNTTSAMLSSFAAYAAGPQIAVQWQTISEGNVSGFYLQRATTITGPYARVPSNQNPQLFPSQGQAGSTYNYLDTGVVNGTAYYYRLEAISPTGTVLFGPVLSVLSVPTVTPTLTPTVTRTITPTRTLTPTVTRTRTVTPTRTLTYPPPRTSTPNSQAYRSPTAYAYKSATPNALTRTVIARTPSLTSTTSSNGYPAPGQSGTSSGDGYPAPGEQNGYPAPGGQTSVTPVPPSLEGTVSVATPTGEGGIGEGSTISPTPSPSPTVSPAAVPGTASGSSGAGFWLSLGLGSILGTAILFLGGWLLFQRRGLPG